MKKILFFAMSMMLIFSPLGTVTFNTIMPAKYEQVSEAHAKGYRSPSRSYRPNNNQVKRNNNTNKATNNQTAAKKSNRGFWGGLMFGGIAGLLFGSMLGNMGAFGDILALIINVIAIILVIRLLIYFFQKWRNRNNPKPQAQVFDHQGTTSGAENTTSNTIVLDEGNISNAVIHFFTHEKGLQLDDVEVILTYDEQKGFGADVMKNGRLVQALDHFSLIQAIRYWATKEAHFDPNCGLDLRFSETEGITAIVTE
ncbi:hypothetical protein PWEIH_05234 [Listeria weihenstephanensis FSL R9-0317]|uniref:DUF2653 domain-containing protein n=1 Tax=Listeria weihenstephanensis TaxID=1006155 RepID=A0A1S7FWH0_9LIST|nr:DUF2653 family protein [Listeria weihenstephanensis]AQY51806.1 hypothetical protein UE46_12740 [Listeria weihenstephanensis]EUJ40113.1 hypothetical protein PWEIH_05234 [Listeria weihenstephanensis FSL R9-0317]